jgi:lysophospholipase L1-like esterase
VTVNVIVARLASLVVVGVLLVASPAAQAPAEHWVATWATSQTLVRGTGLGAGRAGTPPAASSASPAPPPAAPPPAAASGPAPFPGRRFPIPPNLPSVNNQTVRMIVRASVGGRQVRVRLSNAFSGTTVSIGAAAIARSTGGAAIDASSSRALTFSGTRSASIYAGQVLISDPVDLTVAPLSDLAISVYLPGDVDSPTNHRFGLRTTYVAAGDQTTTADIASPVTTTESYYWLAGVDVLAPARTRTIVAFGDSITDGDQSTPNQLAAWPTRLAERLQANRATAHIGVVNAGIAGNRILGDNGGGLARLVHDAISQPGASWIILLEGINDITAGSRQPNAAQPFAANDLIAAYRQVIAQAHVRGIRVAGATLTPFGGSSAYSEAGERVRAAVNEWIRTGRELDAVIDFDRVVRDPNDVMRFRAEADSPDLLHPGDAGYRLMADSIDLTIFTRPVGAK